MTLRTVEIIIDGALSAPTRKNILVHTKEKSPLALNFFFFNDVNARLGTTIESFDAVLPGYEAKLCNNVCDTLLVLLWF